MMLKKDKTTTKRQKNKEKRQRKFGGQKKIDYLYKEIKY
jgi:hypothetical protein